MSLSAELQARGFIKQTTFNDITWLDTPRTVYFGVDPSADSLHVGNLASFMPLRHMLDAGWKVILLVGGATGMIGDPGGKSEERNLLSLEAIASNKQAVRVQVEKLFASQEFNLVDNYDWLSKVSLLEFLRDTGKHFSMTPLIQRDYIAERIGQDSVGISYTEFSYTLLQGYDYWHLYKSFGCELQVGGSDQWGNMLSGVDLIRRKEGHEVHVLASPLIVDNTTGKKFGKTEGGAVWLDGNKTTVYQFYQFWLNVDDGAVIDYLKIYTMLNLSQIEDIMNEFNNDRSARLPHKTLAYEVTKLVHGQDQADKQAHIAEALFTTHNLSDLNEAEIATVREEIPHAKLADNASIVEALVTTGLATSNTEARQLVASGAVYINNTATTKQNLEPTDFINGKLLIRKGKVLKNTALVELP
jgi:tyrosyl-tRNA synthetase